MKMRYPILRQHDKEVWAPGICIVISIVGETKPMFEINCCKQSVTIPAD